MRAGCVSIFFSPLLVDGEDLEHRVARALLLGSCLRVQAGALRPLVCLAQRGVVALLANLLEALLVAVEGRPLVVK